MSDLPPEVDKIFGTLKKPPKELTEKEKLGKRLLELSKLYPKSNE